MLSTNTVLDDHGAQFPIWVYTHSLMASSTRPLKRSRIVTDDVSPSFSTPGPSDSPAPAPTTTLTCTNNNARRLRAHAVTLRLSQQRDRRRQTQQSTHTTIQRDSEDPEDGDMEEPADDWIADGVSVAGNGNTEKGKPADVPKRLVVRGFSNGME